MLRRMHPIWTYAEQHAVIGDRTFTRALEVGGSTGRFTRRRQLRRTELLAVDISPVGLKRIAAGLRPGGMVASVYFLGEFSQPVRGDYVHHRPWLICRRRGFDTSRHGPTRPPDRSRRDTGVASSCAPRAPD